MSWGLRVLILSLAALGEAARTITTRVYPLQFGIPVTISRPRDVQVRGKEE